MGSNYDTALGLGIINRQNEERELEEQELNRPVQTLTGAGFNPRNYSRSKVWDPTTKELIEIDGEEAQAGLASGKYLPDRLSGYRMLDEGGNFKFVSGEEVAHALDKGWTMPNQQDAAARIRKDDNRQRAKDEGLLGAAKLAGAEFVDQALFGIPEAVLGTNPIIQDKEYLEALKEENPTANAIGNVAGVGASLFVGGPLFKAGSSLGARAAAEATKRIGLKSATGIVGSAVKGAVEGAVASAPITISEAALGDPEEAAEHLLLTMGIGAIIPGAVRSLQTIGGAATRKGVQLASKIRPQAGLDAGKLSQGGEVAEQALKEFTDVQAARSHVVGKSKEKAFDAIEDLGGSKAYGQFIKDKGLVPVPGEKFEDVAGRIAKVREQTTESINNILKQADAAIPQSRLPKAKDLQEHLQSALKQAPAADRKQLAKYINDMEGLLEPVELTRIGGDGKIGIDKRYTLGSMQKFRNALNDMVEEGSKSAKPIRDVVEDMIGGSMTKASKEVNEAYQAARRELKLSRFGEELINDTVNHINSNKGDPLKELVSGLPLAAAGEFLFDSMLGGYGVSRATKVASKFMKDNFNRIAAASELGGQSAARNNFSEAISKRFGGRVGLGIADTATRYVKDALVNAPRKAFGGGNSRVLPTVPRLILSKWGGSSNDIGIASQQVQDNLVKERQNLQENQREWNELLTDGAPTVAGAFLQKQQQTIDWLIQQAPKRPDGLLPSDKWIPSKQEARDYAMKLEVASDPKVLLRHIKGGTLQPEHVAAMEALYPRYLENVRNAMGLEAINSKARLTRRQRATYETLMGNAANIQRQDALETAQFMGWGQQPPEQAGPSQGNVGARATKPVKTNPALSMTQSERLDSKGAL